jgi:sporulation protein YlmC with PRC-barrel domain
VTDDPRLRELEEKYEDYKVYDNAGEKIGKVDDLFVDEADREEYIGVKMGLFGLSGTTLIPMEIARVNERDKTIGVSESKDWVKDSPNLATTMRSPPNTRTGSGVTSASRVTSPQRSAAPTAATLAPGRAGPRRARRWPRAAGPGTSATPRTGTPRPR